jgi:hypothetical protein
MKLNLSVGEQGLDGAPGLNGEPGENYEVSLCAITFFKLHKV